METTDDITIKSSAEVFEEWLKWPGKPFAWEECDSPIEDSVFHEFHKFASDQVDLKRQHVIQTDSGTFRLDFLLTHRTTGRPIVIECDGREFHNIERDRARDEAIIRSGAVARIYRVRGKDCHYCSRDVLQLLARCEPWVVTERFHQQATFYPHPTTYNDEIFELMDGYRAMRRVYLEQIEGEYEDRVCYCEGECECVAVPVMVESSKQTSNIVCYMSGAGFSDAFEQPDYLKPLPMPEWKILFRENWEKMKQQAQI